MSSVSSSRRRIVRALVGAGAIAVLLAVAWSLRDIRVVQGTRFGPPGALVLRTGSSTSAIGRDEDYVSISIRAKWPIVDLRHYGMRRIDPRWRFEKLSDGTGRLVSKVDGSIHSLGVVLQPTAPLPR